MNLFLPVFFFLVSCNIASTEIEMNKQQNFIKIPSPFVKDSIIYRKFEYPINNEDASDFAYGKITTSEGDDLFDVGIKTIAIFGGYCLLVDEAHRNVKKINLSNGKKTESSKLVFSERSMLVDIAIHNDFVYVSSNQKEIFVLDSNLNLVRNVELKTGSLYNRHPLFQGAKGNNLLVLISDTLIEITPTGIEINRKKVSPFYKEGAKLTSTGVRFGEIYYDTVITDALDRELYYYNYFGLNEDSYLRGRKYRIARDGDKDIFRNDKHEIKLATPYTHLENTDIRFINDLDFNDNYLVIFEVKPPIINIHVYAFKQ